MTEPPGFDYNALLRGSLLGMVRGLITTEPGVVMSARLLATAPLVDTEAPEPTSEPVGNVVAFGAHRRRGSGKT